jgi:hypothetical protein
MLTSVAGTPKGVLLSHGNVVAASESQPLYTADKQSDPSGHCYTTSLSRTIHTSLSYL